MLPCSIANVIGRIVRLVRERPIAGCFILYSKRCVAIRQNEINQVTVQTL